jgi:chromosome partitioning protein
MKAIAFSLQKGGVGKTSLSATVALELASKGKTVLIDCDPQGNSSSWLAMLDPQIELAQVLMGKFDVAEGICPSNAPGLDLLPTFGLDGELKMYAENGLSQEPFIICDLIEELERIGYKYAVLDLSPGMGRLERAALIAATEVVAPMTPEAFSIDGISIFQAELDATKKALRRGPKFDRIVINGYDARIQQHKDILAKAQDILRSFELYIVPVDPAFRKAQYAHISLQALPRKDAAKPETMAEIKRMGDDLC